jgi:hypothetical protein
MADRLPPALPWARPEAEEEGSLKRPRHGAAVGDAAPAATLSLSGPLFGLQLGDRVEVLWDFEDDEGGDSDAQVRGRRRGRAQSELFGPDSLLLCVVRLTRHLVCLPLCAVVSCDAGGQRGRLCPAL